MMPTNGYQWMFFVLYTLGSFGGMLYIINVIINKLFPVDDEYDNPWSDAAVHYEEPMPHREAPISARKK